MVERKSKPRNVKKADEEPEGFDAIKENPVFLLALIILFIVALVGGIWLLAKFLSGS